MIRMWWCLHSPWHKWAKVVRVSEISDKITCSCGREYGLNNHERIMLPWHMVKELYDDLARIHGHVSGSGGAPVSSFATWTPEGIIRSWAQAYREGPLEHRFPSDPHAEFFPVDLEAAADAIDALRAELAIARAALETIAGCAADKLQAMQAKSALANIGADVGDVGQSPNSTPRKT